MRFPTHRRKVGRIFISGRRPRASASSFAHTLVVVLAVAFVAGSVGSVGLGRSARERAAVTPVGVSHAPSRYALKLQLRAGRLTDEVRALTAAMGTSPSRALRRRLVAASRARRQTLVALLATSPRSVRGFVLSRSTARKLARVRGAWVERSVELTGRYRFWHGDYPRGEVDLDQLVSRGKVFTLYHLGSTQPAADALLTVKGFAFGRKVLATSVSGSTPRMATAATTTGSVEVAVIVATFSDTTAPVDMNAIESNFQDAARYFGESSYGKMTLDPSFFGPYPLATTTSTGCNSLPTQALLTAAAANVTFANYSRLIYVFDCPGSDFGSATSIGPVTTPQGAVQAAQIALDARSAADRFSVVHEISHTLGSFNEHAAGYVCLPDTFDPPDRFDAGCTSAEYGDPFDTLGGPPTGQTPQLDPWHKANAGWFDTGQYPTVSTPGTYTYTLAPYEQTPAGGQPLALNIPRGQSGTAFTVEYRQPIGFDAWMNTPTCQSCTVTQGASIRLLLGANGGGGGSDTQLIDTTPGTIPSSNYYPTDDFRDSALLPGRTFTDPEYGISIKTVSADSSGLTVQVTIPAQTCVHGSPTVTTPSPASVSGGVGQTATTTVTLTNTDSAGCPANTFRYFPPTSSTVNIVASPDYLTLAPGASATVTLGFSAKALTTAGYYGFTSAGYFQSNTLGTGNATVSGVGYQLTSAADTTAPSTPADLTATALGSNVVRVSWTPSTDDTGVVGYKIVRGNTVFMSATSSFVDGGVSPGLSYTYSVQAFDRQGNTSPAGTVTVTTPTQTDSTPPTPPTVTADAGDHSLHVSWTAGSDNVGVAYYRITPCFVPGCTVPASTHSFTVTGLPSRTRYDVQVIAVDGDGNMSGLGYGKYTVYTAAAGDTAPSQPQQLVSTVGTYHHVELSWLPSTGGSGIAGYAVFRNNRQVATVASTSYTDTLVGYPSEYYVQAIDTDGSLSAPSARIGTLMPTMTSSDSTPPSASISDPAPGATVSGAISVSATASDDVGIRRVELWVDGVLTATDTAAPYTFSLDTTTLSDGAHWLFARAYDTSGNYETDGVTNVTVANGPSDPTPPSVSIMAPSDGATVTGPVTISADATDSVGVADVSIAVDGSSLCTDTSAPYTCAWDATAPGDHTIEATASDDAGNQASATVAVTVSAPPADTTPPSVSFGAPADGATVSGTASVQASASDDTGVASVALAVDGTTVATDTSGPWTFSVDTTKLANGSHTLTATASDAAGNSASAQESVTVSNFSDTKAPSTPSGLKLAVAGTSQVAVYWSPSTDNVGVAGYDVFRDGVLVAQTTVPNYLDGGLLPGTTHAYTVKAFDAAGNISAATAKLSVKAASLARSTTSTITGVVYSSATWKPLANAVVTLSGMGLTKTAKTNNTGVYKFSTLPVGTYTITVSTASTSVSAFAGQIAVVASSS